jgi:hypothetical protein
VIDRLNLTAVLTALAVLDLVLDRVLGRLFMPAPAAARTLGRLTAQTGAFVSYLGGALALFVFIWCFVGLLRRRELFPRSMRLVVALLALSFVVLLSCSMTLFHLPARLFVQLKTSHAFLAWLVAAALWRAPVPVRARVGVTLFVLPAMLHTAALFFAEMGWGRSELLPGDLARAGELLAFVAAGAAPLLLPLTLKGTRFGAVAWIAGLCAVGGLVAAAVLRFDLMKVVAEHGLRVELPPPSSAGAWAYVMLLGLAVLGTALLVMPAIAAGGGDRLIGCGVLLMVTSGYQIASAPDLAISACGLLALALGVTRRMLGTPPAAVAPSPPEAAPAPAPAT